MSDITRTNNLPNPDAQRLLDLLADRATGPLSSTDQAELDFLLRRVPALTDALGRSITAESVDDVAGSLMFALGAKPQELPSAARERLLARGREIAREVGTLSQAREQSAGAAPRQRSGSGPFAYVGWLVAAAAIALAFVLNYQSQPSATQLRSALLAQPGTVTLDWLPQGPYEAQNVSGDVVWNNAKQEGYVRFKNLAAMDPSKNQFQLWIFDKSRDDKYPVDGGVFNLDQAKLDPTTGEYLVKINPKLPVSAPAAFAVSVEKPGGVVVTDRSHLVTLAPVP